MGHNREELRREAALMRSQLDQIWREARNTLPVLRSEVLRITDPEGNYAGTSLSERLANASIGLVLFELEARDLERELEEGLE